MAASSPISDALLDPLRHNAWANAKLLGFCKDLNPEQLGASAEGTYGSILATLQHMVGAEGRYCSRLVGRQPEWPAAPEETEDVGQLGRMAADLATMWEEVAGGEFDPDRLVRWPSSENPVTNEARAGILVAQALNHGNEHRSQVSTVLTTIGLEPPELDGWGYAIETGRFRELPRDDSP